jgi:hypothetical protein
MSMSTEQVQYMYVFKCRLGAVNVWFGQSGWTHFENLYLLSYSIVLNVKETAAQVLHIFRNFKRLYGQVSIE